MMTGLLSPGHVIIILIVALVVLGPKRLPSAARSLGHGLREFKDSVTGGDDHEDVDLAALKAPTPETGKTPAQPAH